MPFDAEELALSQETTTELSPLFRHQAAARFRALADQRLFLAHDTGTGKTRTTLEVLWHGGGVTLILCPKSIVRTSWLQDARRFCPELEIAAGTGKPKERKAAFERLISEEIWALVLNYESFRVDWPRWWERAFEAGRIHTLILDESTKIKSHSARISKVVRKAAGLVKRCHCLSGCPAPNTPAEWWSQVVCLRPEVLGRSYFAFHHTYFYQPSAERTSWLWVPKPRWMMPPAGGEAAIMEKLRPHVDFVSKKDALDLPAQSFLVREVELAPVERKLYDVFLKELLLELAGDRLVVASNALTQVMKLRQFTAGIVRTTDLAGEAAWTLIGESKLDALLELVDELGPQRNVLVLCQFVSELVRVAERLSGIGRVVTLYGATSEADRERAVVAFQEGDARFLVGNPAAMSHGLNLQHKCSDSIWMSLSYSYEQFKQTCDRLHRHGQGLPVSHFLLLAKDTIDEKIWAALQKKRDVAAELMSILQELRREP